MPHNLYRGVQTATGPLVLKNGEPLALARSVAIRNHSPTGFSWGYGGSGPSQLALAMLLEELDDDELALAIYHDFKFAVVANMAPHGWFLRSEDIEEWLGGIRVGLTTEVADVGDES